MAEQHRSTAAGVDTAASNARTVGIISETTCKKAEKFEDADVCFMRVNEAVRRLRPCRVLSPIAAAADDDDAGSWPAHVDQAMLCLRDADKL